MKKLTIFIIAIIFNVNTAKADIPIGLSKLKESEACPSTQKYKCAPTNDPKIFLEDNPILETEDAEIWSYIGGIKIDKSGSIPARCVTSDIPDGLIVKKHISSFAINYKKTSSKRFGIGLDMINALRVAGTSNAILDKAEAGIQAAYAKVGDEEVVTQGEYWTYKLKNSEISALKGIGSKNIFKTCLSALKVNKDNGIIIGIGGFWIKESLAISNKAKQLSLGVTAALKNAGVDEKQIASLSAVISSQSTRVVSTELRDVFEARAINFLTASSIIKLE